MLDGVQARLLLQAAGLVLLPIGSILLLGSISRLWSTIERWQFVFAPAFDASSNDMLGQCLEAMSYDTAWCIVCGIIVVFGWRLLLCKGRLFPALVRSLAQ